MATPVTARAMRARCAIEDRPWLTECRMKAAPFKARTASVVAAILNGRIMSARGRTDMMRGKSCPSADTARSRPQRFRTQYELRYLKVLVCNATKSNTSSRNHVFLMCAPGRLDVGHLCCVQIAVTTSTRRVSMQISCPFRARTTARAVPKAPLPKTQIFIGACFMTPERGAAPPPSLSTGGVMRARDTRSPEDISEASGGGLFFSQSH